MGNLKQYQVSIYLSNGYIYNYWFDTKEFAINFADKEFKDKDVLTIKIWDLHQGEPQHRNLNAPGIIYQL